MLKVVGKREETFCEKINVPHRMHAPFLCKKLDQLSRTCNHFCVSRRILRRKFWNASVCSACIFTIHTNLSTHKKNYTPNIGDKWMSKSKKFAFFLRSFIWRYYCVVLCLWNTSNWPKTIQFEMTKKLNQSCFIFDNFFNRKQQYSPLNIVWSIRSA